ncbi:MAG: hypothetical protein KKC20_23570 [Proteobacteria bacterium]|nr:hypothetical protein [Pseudomonadota bacterium]
MTLSVPTPLKSFHQLLPLPAQDPKRLFFESMTTEQIAAFPREKQKALEQDLTFFFPTLFADKHDWEYMVRHFFYIPKGNTLRQAIFVRNEQEQLIALCAFDHGVFQIEEKETSLIYIHIRAVAPGFQTHGLGRIFSEKILHLLSPDILMTTCVQLASLYSWIKTQDADIQNAYEFFPRVETVAHTRKTIPLPQKDLDFTLKCFKRIYASHVKENQRRLDDVINNLTVHLVRKEVNTYFNFLKWNENNKKSTLAQDLGITEKDAVLLVIRKRIYSIENRSKEE